MSLYKYLHKKNVPAESRNTAALIARQRHVRLVSVDTNAKLSSNSGPVTTIWRGTIGRAVLRAGFARSYIRKTRPEVKYSPVWRWDSPASRKVSLV
jgi:hypothetical protein